MFPTCDYHTHPQGHNVRPYTIDLLQPWIEQCRAKGIQSIAFTDHDRYIAGIDFAVIDRLREQNPDVQILAGIELDNDPLTSTSGVRWVERNWDRLDFVLGSVHYFSGETEMLDRAGEAEQIESRGAAEAFDQYVRELEKLISRGHIDCLSHLDLVKIHGLLPRNYDPAKLFRTDSRAGEKSRSGNRSKHGRLAKSRRRTISSQVDLKTGSRARDPDYDCLGRAFLRSGRR